MTGTFDKNEFMDTIIKALDKDGGAGVLSYDWKVSAAARILEGVQQKYNLQQTEPDGNFRDALQAVDEMMNKELPPTKEEWLEWGERWLPLMKRVGCQRWTNGFAAPSKELYKENEELRATNSHFLQRLIEHWHGPGGSGHRIHEFLGVTEGDWVRYIKEYSQSAPAVFTQFTDKGARDGKA